MREVHEKLKLKPCLAILQSPPDSANLARPNGCDHFIGDESEAETCAQFGNFFAKSEPLNFGGLL